MTVEDPTRLRPDRLDSLKEGEYTAEDISNILFWSAYLGQGSEYIQYGAIKIFYCYYPNFARALEAYVEAWNEDDENQDIKNLAERVMKRRNGPTHPGNKQAEVEVAQQIHLELSGIDAGIKDIKRNGVVLERGAYAKQCLVELADELMGQDMQLADPNSGNTKLLENRKRIGWSMVCFLGLSPNRESRKEFLMLPQEYQQLWRELNTYIRANVATLSPLTKKELRKLVELYEKETGESLGLSVP